MFTSVHIAAVNCANRRVSIQNINNNENILVSCKKLVNVPLYIILIYIVFILNLPGQNLETKFWSPIPSGFFSFVQVLTEILATRSNSQIKEIRELYKKHHKDELEKALTSETSGDYRHLLVSFNNVSYLGNTAKVKGDTSIL